MRTTVSISEHLLTAAKQRAHERGQTLGDVVDDALRHELARDVEPAPRPPVPVLRAGGGPRPGVDLTSNRALVQVLDEGLDLDRLR